MRRERHCFLSAKARKIGWQPGLFTGSGRHGPGSCLASKCRRNYSHGSFMVSLIRRSGRCRTNRLEACCLQSLIACGRSQLKCVRSFPKKRLIDTLQDYVAGEKHRYYNVVHWLDLGVSAPKEIALRSAAKVLAREWSE